VLIAVLVAGGGAGGWALLGSRGGKQGGAARPGAGPAKPGAGPGAAVAAGAAELRDRLDEALRASDDPPAPASCRTADPAALELLGQAASLVAGGAPDGNRPADVEAARLLDGAGEGAHAAAEYWYLLGRARLQGGADPVDLLAAAERAVELCPDYAAALSLVGTARFRTKRLDDAEAAYRRALALAPAFTTARYNFGLVALEQGHTDEGLAALERVTTDKPDHAAAFFALGVAYTRAGRSDDALRACRRSRDLGNPAAAKACPD
jgi:tetratricopeptide (TPR) repeat protein